MRRIRSLVGASALAFFIGTASAESVDSTIAVPMRTLAAVFGMALAGGLASWITKVRAGVITGWSLTQLIGELCISAFAGAMCFLLCESFSVSLRMTMFLTGVAGHMGARAIAAFEKFAEKKWGDIAGVPPADKP